MQLKLAATGVTATALLALALFGHASVVGSCAVFGLLLALLASVWRDADEREDARRIVVIQTAALNVSNARLTESEHVLAVRLEERDVLNVALERSNLELDQFAYVASHDLKAPLRGITNLSVWIEEDLGASMTDTARDHLALLRGRARRMELLIDGILAYSRASRGTDRPAPVDVRALVLEQVDSLAPPADTVVRVPDVMPHLVCERVAFQQVWMNLLGNAFKHARRAGAVVTVGVADRGESWEFSVTDNGPGIEAKYHARVFGLFQTLASRDKIEGTGIGLTLVKKIVESRGGAVTIDSAPGAGTTFRFRWPKEFKPEAAVGSHPRRRS